MNVRDFSPGLLAMQENPLPALPRFIYYAVAGLFAILLAWALLAKVDVVAVAEGKLVPQTYTKIVQPAEAGVVTEILVKEGDLVRSGQTLIRLDATVVTADGSSLAHDMAHKKLVLRRVDAELAGQTVLPMPGDQPALLAQVQAQARAHAQAYRDAQAQEMANRERAHNELASAQETWVKLKTTLPSYQQSAGAHQKLVQEGFLSPIAGNDKEREAIEKAQDLKAQAATVLGLQATIAAQDQKIASIASNYRSQLLVERTEAMAQLARLTQDQAKMAFKTNLLELKAPQDGVVKDIATTSKGAVVQPGMVLLNLVPVGEPLLAEVLVKNEDVGFVQIGQPVRIKIAAYPFQKHGLLQGSIEALAPDAQVATSTPGQNAQQGYKALVKLEHQHLASASGYPQQHKALAVGMMVVAEIHQGRRTVMEYLLEPLQKVAAQAGRER